MKEARYFYVPNATEDNELPTDEAIHAIRVLRLKIGDDIFLIDGKGSFYEAVVTLANSKHCLYKITQTLVQNKTWKGHIHLAIAPTKDISRIEWLVEKATEIGFDEISFLNCQFSERKNLRIDRIERIVISAMKQSRKAWKPIVNNMLSFEDFMQKEVTGQKFICHCYNEIEKTDFFSNINNSGLFEDITVLIGPEGDFSINEVHQALQQQYKSTTLGNSRLRTETAGLAAVLMANLANRI
ncbi:16S rRNA (uracil(1498)-N(3))-methyltransferase [Prevotella pallens]|jgi:RNA methyltransferase, rsmE family|uniref:Ribosomal RNA small subunit methyltransferase E n=2 Tax=Prevotella pallens TaxID=60133 RepID=F9DI47_9BACT|nr:16S rRNA (uracil(1498)-N(3))-methyltransferase [Prevotella pallens]EGQ18090.1 RsmE family RNA methyltransferase [Prevotella pallens ATCC 700821]MBF1451443.1 16S rRNA (uracil(1498)-N(3))-methyltransferase [Prevotella pallens]MBF1508717.1 16S rRNA (uracil(1498)-N(3))-methyltransferase [Prevotella pallens]MBF1510852.1 16S rRNA (uracil(1498)-N(3))-methyltransferase [Prevotella pallens]RAS43906.1 16S rRNA (uracil1498-N3)-methyltransferase [Prevotella pallens]